MSPAQTEVRAAVVEDAPLVASLFRTCFGDSVTRIFPDGLPDWVTDELMKSVIMAEPGCCAVATAEEDLLGYCISPASMTRLWWGVLTGRPLWRIIAAVLRREIPLSRAALAEMSRDKLAFVGSFRRFSVGRTGQILSVAVSPPARGMGVGKLLIGRALQYLVGRGVRRVKLEVRPDNVPAVRLYRGFGFEAVGQTRDGQGEWTVMSLSLGPRVDACS